MSRLAQVKLLEIKACDGKATSNRNSYVRLRPQRTDELGADPDTAIYLEPPCKSLGGSFFFLLSPAARQQAGYTKLVNRFFEGSRQPIEQGRPQIARAVWVLRLATVRKPFNRSSKYW
jgi:hypothetical protein